MAAGSRARRIVTGLTLVALASSLLYFDRHAQREGRRGTGALAGALTAVVAPIQSGVTDAGRAVRGWWLDYVALLELRAEHRALQAQLDKALAEAARTAELLAENERLRQLIDLADRRKDLRLRAARVVARSTNPLFRVLRVVIDVSEDERIEPGMPVIALGGVVGQIRDVSPGRAEVLLVTDPRSAIDVVLEQSRARGLAVGTGEPDRYAARLDYLERSVKAVAGERVLTTGDDGRYPRGLVVGEVSHVQDDDSGPFQQASVRPLVDLSAIDEVFVVLGPTGLTPDGSDYERAGTPDR